MTEDIFDGYGVLIKLKNDDDFLKVKETLTRIGVESIKRFDDGDIDKTLYQSCHILHKRGEYAIMHFKEMYALDGRETNYSEDDEERRNSIVKLLNEWGLIQIIDVDYFLEESKFAPISKIKIIPYSKKKEWNLRAKYNIGVKKRYD